MMKENIAIEFLRCKSIIDKDNKPKDLSEDEKKKITKDVIEKMANDGLRTICIAYRDLGKEKQNWDDEDKIIKDLICIGLVGIEDPVRDEVSEFYKSLPACRPILLYLGTGSY